jgi:HK97 family phage major capsid protein
MTFLKTIDQGLEGFDGKFQKQLDDIFVKMETSRPGRPGANKKAEKELTRKWLVAYLKKQPREAIEAELKDFTPTHTTVALDDSGAVLVPELLASEINHYIIEGGIARREMRYYPISGPGNTRNLPVETGGVSVSWVDEAGPKPITGLTLERVQQKLEKLAAIAVITEELIEDAAFDLVSYIARRIADAIATEEDRVFFAGDTSGGDPFDGIINAAGTVPVYLGAGTDMDDVTADSLLAMVYSIPKHARPGAKFYMHSDVLYRIQKLRIDVLAVGDGLGGYLVQPATASAPASIWGYPIVTVDQLPDALDDVTDTGFMIFANLQKTCVYGDKNNIHTKLLTEATLTDSEGGTISLGQNDAVAIRVYKRVGYVPVLPEGIAILIAGEAGSGSGLN